MRSSHASTAEGQALLAAAEKARRDVNDLAEFVMQDPTGAGVRQGVIHRCVQAHIDWCWQHSLYAGIVAPFGHGKTEQILLRIIRELGQNQNLRCKIVCNADENAQARVEAIKTYIERCDALRLVYPNLLPDRTNWGKTSFRVRRSTISKDASLEAWGIDAKGVGGRADLIVFDDVCDIKDIHEPSTRLKKADTFDLTWMSRLVKGGRAIYIATAWHEKDLTHQLLRNSQWSTLWMAVSQDLTSIDVTLHNADETHPLRQQHLQEAA